MKYLRNDDSSGRKGRNGMCLMWRYVATWLILFHAAPALAQGDTVGEYELKAAFLYNFARFVEWPATKSDAYMLFCIASDEGVARQVETTLAGRKIESREIQVQRLRRGADVTQCSLVFITQSSPREFQSVAAQLGEMQILTVTESRDFPREGGIINFYVAQERVRFEIAVEAAERAGVKLSSKLLSLGRLVHGQVSAR